MQMKSQIKDNDQFIADPKKLFFMNVKSKWHWQIKDSLKIYKFKKRITFYFLNLFKLMIFNGSHGTGLRLKSAWKSEKVKFKWNQGKKFISKCFNKNLNTFHPFKKYFKELVLHFKNSWKQIFQTNRNFFNRRKLKKKMNFQSSNI